MSEKILYVIASFAFLIGLGFIVGTKWEHHEITETCKKSQRYVYDNRFVLECQLHDINEVLERKYSERL